MQQKSNSTYRCQSQRIRIKGRSVADAQSSEVAEWWSRLVADTAVLSGAPLGQPVTKYCWVSLSLSSSRMRLQTPNASSPGLGLSTVGFCRLDLGPYRPAATPRPPWKTPWNLKPPIKLFSVWFYHRPKADKGLVFIAAQVEIKKQFNRQH